jgi:surface protein
VYFYDKDTPLSPGSPLPSATPTQTPTSTVTPTPSITPTQTVTPTGTNTPTPTPTPSTSINYEEYYMYTIDTTIQTTGIVSGTTTLTDQYMTPSIVQTTGAGYTIDFGDGTVLNMSNSQSYVHTYSSPGQYLIKIKPQNSGEYITKIRHFGTTGDSSKILGIVSWGNDVCNYQNFTEHLRKCQSLSTLPSAPYDVQPIFPPNTDMTLWFGTMSSFNYDISGWDVSNVVNMSQTFRSIQGVVMPFNQDISGWNVSNVTNMYRMFWQNKAFNQDISSWDVSNVTNMSEMFRENTAFDQNLGSWNITNVTNMTNMFNNSVLSTSNYDNTLIGWASQSVQSSVPLGVNGLTYTLGGAAEAARTTLTTTYSWVITGDSGI